MILRGMPQQRMDYITMSVKNVAVHGVIHHPSAEL